MPDGRVAGWVLDDDLDLLLLRLRLLQGVVVAGDKALADVLVVLVLLHFNLSLVLQDLGEDLVGSHLVVVDLLDERDLVRVERGGRLLRRGGRLRHRDGGGGLRGSEPSARDGLLREVLQELVLLGLGLVLYLKEVQGRRHLVGGQSLCGLWHGFRDLCTRARQRSVAWRLLEVAGGRLGALRHILKRGLRQPVVLACEELLVQVGLHPQGKPAPALWSEVPVLRGHECAAELGGPHLALEIHQPLFLVLGGLDELRGLVRLLEDPGSLRVVSSTCVGNLVQLLPLLLSQDCLARASGLVLVGADLASARCVLQLYLHGSPLGSAILQALLRHGQVVRHGGGPRDVSRRCAHLLPNAHGLGWRTSLQSVDSGRYLKVGCRLHVREAVEGAGHPECLSLGVAIIVGEL